MKALSVKPKWADLIRSGAKTIELRSWPTRHRGPLLICSSQPDGYARCIVNVLDCRPALGTDAGDACCEVEANDKWAWTLGAVTLIEPIPVKGRLMLYDVLVPDSALFIQPADLAAAL